MRQTLFGPFTVESSGTRLLRDGEDLGLRPKAVRALLVLTRHAGHVVEYEQLMSEAWSGITVHPHTVDVTVREAKRVLGEYGTWIRRLRGQKAAFVLEVPPSDALIRRGWHCSDHETPEAAAEALECFQQAARLCPEDLRVYDGLAQCYLYGVLSGTAPSLHAYPRFLDAHRRACAGGRETGVQRARFGHGVHVFEHSVARAEAELQAALSLQPACADAFASLAVLYGASQRFDEADEALLDGQNVNALSRPLAIASVQVRVWQRDFERAVAVALSGVTLHPYSANLRMWYAQSLHHAGRADEALRQFQLASILASRLPWLRALEAICMVSLGTERDAAKVLGALRAERHRRFVDMYYVAALSATLQHTTNANAELRVAQEENSAFIYALRVDPYLDTLRHTSAFRRLLGATAGKGTRRVQPAEHVAGAMTSDIA